MFIKRVEKLKRKLHGLADGHTVHFPAFFFDGVAAVLQNRIDIGVGPLLIVMKQSQFFHAGPKRQFQDIFIGRMSPTAGFFVFCLFIFRVMEEQIGIPAKCQIFRKIERSGIQMAGTVSVHMARQITGH